MTPGSLLRRRRTSYLTTITLQYTTHPLPHEDIFLINEFPFYCIIRKELLPGFLW